MSVTTIISSDQLLYLVCCSSGSCCCWVRKGREGGKKKWNTFFSFLSSIGMRAVPGIPSPSKKPSLVISSWVAGEEELGCCSACSSGEERRGEKQRGRSAVSREDSLSLPYSLSSGWATQGHAACPALLSSALKCAAALLQQLLMCCRPHRGRGEKTSEWGREWGGSCGLSVCEYIWMSGIVKKAKTLYVSSNMPRVPIPGLSACLQLSLIKLLNINEVSKNLVLNLGLLLKAGAAPALQTNILHYIGY